MRRSSGCSRGELVVDLAWPVGARGGVEEVDRAAREGQDGLMGSPVGLVGGSESGRGAGLGGEPSGAGGSTAGQAADEGRVGAGVEISAAAAVEFGYAAQAGDGHVDERAGGGAADFVTQQAFGDVTARSAPASPGSLDHWARPTATVNGKAG